MENFWIKIQKMIIIKILKYKKKQNNNKKQNKKVDKTKKKIQMMKSQPKDIVKLLCSIHWNMELLCLILKLLEL